MHHKLCDISTCGLRGLRKGDEHPTFAAAAYYGTFTFSLVDDEKCSCGIGGVT